MLADYHVHSTFSDDSNYPVNNICEDAICRNLSEICFTDHVDYGIKPDVERTNEAHLVNGKPILNVDYAHYFPTIEAAAEMYESELTVRRGLELGVQSHTIDAYNQLIEQWGKHMDFALLSIHQVQNKELWTGEFQKGRTQKEYNAAYYDELLNVVEHFQNYSVVAHLDLIKRYDPAGILPFAYSQDIIAAILKRVIQDGKGIEINTSSFRYGLHDLQPCTQILELYRDLGGTIITLGSDTHKPEHLGAYLLRISRRLSALGFTQFYTFKNWEPTPHALEQ